MRVVTYTATAFTISAGQMNIFNLATNCLKNRVKQSAVSRQLLKCNCSLIFV